MGNTDISDRSSWAGLWQKE